VPGGLACKTPSHYLADLKVRADWRGSRVLSRLMREAKRQIETSDTIECFSVVMGGTGRLPTDYTGRLGVPPFEKLGEITILRLALGGRARKSMSCRIVTLDVIRSVVEGMGLTGYQCDTSEHPFRSQIVPVHLVSGKDDACATLEDTRRVKRLFLDTGEEWGSAHLSSFRYRTPMAGRVASKGRRVARSLRRISRCLLRRSSQQNGKLAAIPVRLGGDRSGRGNLRHGY
jgi:hypothetical protein